MKIQRGSGQFPKTYEIDHTQVKKAFRFPYVDDSSVHLVVMSNGDHHILNSREWNELIDESYKYFGYPKILNYEVNGTDKAVWEE